VRALVLFCLTGCDALFRLSTVDDPVALDGAAGDGMPGTCFYESFSGADSDLLVNWDRYADSTSCKATVNAGELLIDIEPSVDCYADAHSIRPTSFVGGTASVHVTKATTSSHVETLFTLRVDSSNAYYFDVSGGILSFQQRVAGVDMPNDEITYDALAHAYWQFLYVPEGPRIAFRTSADGETWIERHSVIAVVPPDALEIALEAGTYSGGNPGGEMARFDDFVRCSP
jgi:hypothetical protein